MFSLSHHLPCISDRFHAYSLHTPPSLNQVIQGQAFHPYADIYFINLQAGQDKSSQSVMPLSESLSASLSKDLEPSDQDVQDLLNWSSNLGNDDTGFM